MRPKLALAGIVALGTMVLATPTAHAQDSIDIRIDQHARLTADGGVVLSISIKCGPLPGVEEFQEGFAGASQARTGAEAEGGIDGTVVCDGVRRRHTARLSSFTDERFRRGPARANATLFVCQLVGDDQMCFSDSAQRRIVIARRTVP